MPSLRHRKDRNRYQLDYVDADGIRRRPLCPKGTTKRQAENMLREITAGVRSGLAPVKRKISDTTVDELIGLWIASGRQRWTHQTRVARIGVWERYISPRYGSARVDTLEAIEIAAWLDSLSLAPATQSMIRNTLRAACRWGLERGHATIDPTEGVKGIKVPQGTPRYLTRDEYEAVLGYAEGDVRDGIVLAVRTGLRLGELVALGWRDIQGQAIVVSRSMRATDGKIQGRTKGGKARRVPLHPEAAAVLTRRRPGASLARVLPLEYHWFRRRVTQALRASGVSEGGPHILRHTMASWWVQSGGSLMALQRILGHARLEMTLVYAHLAPDSVMQEAERIWCHMGTSPSDTTRPGPARTAPERSGRSQRKRKVSK